mgnify:CR=1 FL=1
MDGTGKEQLCGKINDLPMMDPGMHMLGGEKRIVFGPERFWPSVGSLVCMHCRAREIPDWG